MISILIPGSRCWLDGQTEVIVLKAITRSHSTYIVEIPGRSFDTVATERLTLIEVPNVKEENPNLAFIR
ncbi:MAG: hypothetical protein DI539_26455 [Flavobacterium psychrophilum]|jgi:hypothetical protein|nr:MAG: hypothetical protein DI539_26455 [Flavobacterium psychrophilum]